MSEELENGLAVHVVLDRSGSMASNRVETINAYNSYVSKLAADTPDARLSLTLFDSEGIDAVVLDTKAKDVKPLTEATYVPRSWTPLYDAIGKVVPQLDGVGTKAKVLVILTDGLENASREFTKDIIRKVLAEKQALGWLVLFLGAGIDSFAEGGKIGADARSTMNYNKAGFQKTSDAMYASTARYASAAAGGQSLNLAQDAAAFTDDERKKAMEDDDA